MNLINKIILNYKSQGIKKTLVKILFQITNIVFLKKYLRDKNTKNILKLKTSEERFSKIYQSNYWIDNESKSGAGSNFESTKNIKFHLPILIKKFNIESIFDAPCGDFNWIDHVLRETNVDYIGSDIVEELILSNKKNFQNKKTKFSKLDITKDKLPKSDLMICRDCLFHLSYADIFSFFKNFLSSEIKYILVTSHLNKEYNFRNKDIVSGDFRLLDIFSEPFNIQKEFIYEFDDRDSLEIKNFKQMYLFSTKKIRESLQQNNK